ncbi:Hypothetical predicted protein, partial [Pelobates cultripes]
ITTIYSLVHEQSPNTHLDNVDAGQSTLYHSSLRKGRVLIPGEESLQDPSN